MTDTYQYANPYIYETAEAECVGGPMAGKYIPIRGIYVLGPFRGRYQLVTYGDEVGRLSDVDYMYTFDPDWKPGP